ncbi:MAG TPA: hypothetical protein VHC69_34265 [Polyangiaceae bacterium]|nr:hypothetical protein [Polyangiaceae bacterium]
MFAPKREPTLRVVTGVPGPPERSTSDEAVLAAFARRDRCAAEMVYDHLIGVVDATLYRVIGRREAGRRGSVRGEWIDVRGGGAAGTAGDRD